MASAANAVDLFGIWSVDELPRHRAWACELAAEFSPDMPSPTFGA